MSLDPVKILGGEVWRCFREVNNRERVVGARRVKSNRVIGNNVVPLRESVGIGSPVEPVEPFESVI